ncbi:MAG: acetyl-coenzyme A synthetase N-terminal domain-containing protein, partial [Gemmatimonadota bacterium]
EKAGRDRLGFWEDRARELDWFEEWDSVLEWDPPQAKWFTGGSLNAAHNCLDRHLGDRGDEEALVWEGEPGDRRTY